MCRLLAICSRSPIDVVRHLDGFSRMCARSPEYQGHGWGCAVRRGTTWVGYHTLNPIWHDAYRPEGEIYLFVAHARSAFRNEGITIGNTMPFIVGNHVFVFNGELHGVRLPIPGSTGAHKLFQFLLNQRRQSVPDAENHALRVLRRRTAYIRACNFILADGSTLYVHSFFNAAPDYFTLHWQRTRNELIICSSPYGGTSGPWSPLPNNYAERIPCF